MVDMSNATLTDRLDRFIALHEEIGTIDGENVSIPARGSAAYPSSHPRYLATLDGILARCPGASLAAQLRAEILAVSPGCVARAAIEVES